MAVEGNQFVACGACGKKYPWNPSLPGKNFKCSCGAVTMVPADRSAASAGDDGYDLVDTPTEPAPKPRQAPSASVAEAVRQRMGAVPPPKASGPDPAAEAAARELASMMELSPMRDIIVPTIVLGIGLALSYWEVLRASPHPPGSAVGVAVWVVVRAVVSMALMVGGIFLSTAIFEVSILGSFQRSIYKLCAIAIGPSALYGLLGYLLGYVAGSTAGVFASVIAYGLLFFFLLKLDLKDTAVCVLVTWVLVTAVNYAIFRFQGASSGSWL